MVSDKKFSILESYQANTPLSLLYLIVCNLNGKGNAERIWTIQKCRPIISENVEDQLWKVIVPELVGRNNVSNPKSASGRRGGGSLDH